MSEIKLGEFIVLADGRRFCILNQKKIGSNHFASALTVPKEDGGIEEIKNAEYTILQSVILSDGKIGTREYPKTENDYKEVMDLLKNDDR